MTEVLEENKTAMRHMKETFIEYQREWDQQTKVQLEQLLLFYGEDPKKMTFADFFQLLDQVCVCVCVCVCVFVCVYFFLMFIYVLHLYLHLNNIRL